MAFTKLVAFEKAIGRLDAEIDALALTVSQATGDEFSRQILDLAECFLRRHGSFPLDGSLLLDGSLPLGGNLSMISDEMAKAWGRLLDKHGIEPREESRTDIYVLSSDLLIRYANILVCQAEA